MALRSTLEKKETLSGKVLSHSVISIFSTKLSTYGQNRKIKKVKESSKIGKRAGGMSQSAFFQDNEVWPVKKPGLSVM